MLVGFMLVGKELGERSDAVTQNACLLCAAISGEISILIQTRAESWGRFPVLRICRWESTLSHIYIKDLTGYVGLPVFYKGCLHS